MLHALKRRCYQVLVVILILFQTALQINEPWEGLFIRLDRKNKLLLFVMHFELIALTLVMITAESVMIIDEIEIILFKKDCFVSQKEYFVSQKEYFIY